MFFRAWLQQISGIVVTTWQFERDARPYPD